MPDGEPSLVRATLRLCTCLADTCSSTATELRLTERPGMYVTIDNPTYSTMSLTTIGSGVRLYVGGRQPALSKPMHELQNVNRSSSRRRRHHFPGCSFPSVENDFSCNSHMSSHHLNLVSERTGCTSDALMFTSVRRAAPLILDGGESVQEARQGFQSIANLKPCNPKILCLELLNA